MVLEIPPSTKEHRQKSEANAIFVAASCFAKNNGRTFSNIANNKLPSFVYYECGPSRGSPCVRSCNFNFTSHEIKDRADNVFIKGDVDKLPNFLLINSGGGSGRGVGSFFLDSNLKLLFISRHRLCVLRSYANLLFRRYETTNDSDIYHRLRFGLILFNTSEEEL